MLRETLCASSVRVRRRSGVVVKLNVRLITCYICLQQYLSEVLILMLCSLQTVFVELWIVLFEVLQPVVQPPDNVVQLLKKICPVVFHPDPPEILLDCDLHLIETPRQATAWHIVGDVGRAEIRPTVLNVEHAVARGAAGRFYNDIIRPRANQWWPLGGLGNPYTVLKFAGRGVGSGRINRLVNRHNLEEWRQSRLRNPTISNVERADTWGVGRDHIEGRAN
jgi:hypothetical protein